MPILLVHLCCQPAAKPYTEQHAYSAIPPASPASFRRQQQLQHMRQQRQQHNMEREERCLAGDAAAAAAAGGGARPKAAKAQNAQQQARLKHNQGVKASANVSRQERLGQRSLRTASLRCSEAVTWSCCPALCCFELPCAQLLCVLLHRTDYVLCLQPYAAGHFGAACCLPGFTLGPAAALHCAQVSG